MDSSDISKSVYKFSSWQKFSLQNKNGLLAKLPKDIGVYVIRLSDTYFGRLRGNSDILYIGKTAAKTGIRERVRGYFNYGPTQFTNRRINSFLIKQTPMEIAYAILKENPRTVEKLLLNNYLKDHDELPPFNHNL